MSYPPRYHVGYHELEACTDYIREKGKVVPERYYDALDAQNQQLIVLLREAEQVIKNLCVCINHEQSLRRYPESKRMLVSIQELIGKVPC